MNHQCIALGYTNCLQSHYAKLKALPGFVLLESKDTRLGRYDILSAYPYDRVTITNQSPNIEAQLRAISERLKPEETGLDLPFQGGAMGFISYDLGAKLAQLELRPQANLKDLPLLDLGFYDWAIIADHYLKTVTLFAANKEASTKKIIPSILNLWNEDSKACEFKLKSSFKPLMSKKQYEKAFNAIYKALRAGRSYQVNLTQAFSAPFEGDPWRLYEKISSQNPVPFSAFMRGKEADILSFSPERFILYDKGSLLSSPIKGTIGRSYDLEEDEKLKSKLKSCPKNRAENVMIVDLLRNDLGKIAKPNSVKVETLCAIQSFHSVHHLVSDIKANCLESVSPFEAFLSCFPGGSITGAPKLEAMRVINEQEGYSRGIYCGSLGYFSAHGRFDTNIAIRTLTACKEVLHLAAGGGVVIDSVMDDEYQECFTKILAVTKPLDEAHL